MSETWNKGEGQPINRGYNNGGSSFGSRNFNNSNYRGPRRDGAPPTGGYQGSRPNAFPGATNGGGYGNNQRSFAQPAGGRQFYGDRQQRMNFNGPPRTGGGYNNFSQSAASSKIDIDSSKVGMVIGRGGGKIREIQVNFNVHVKIDRDPGLNGLTGVTIRGEENSIEQAKHFIQDLIAVK